MSVEYGYATPVKTGNVVYRSFTEAMWARLFTGLGIEFEYEPATFEFPDGIVYTPDFFLKSVKRYIEVKNGNVDTESCLKINNLARHLGGHTILLNGSPKVASAYTFDGRPPREKWEASMNPLIDFAFDEIYGHNAGVIINCLLQPDAYNSVQVIFPNRPMIGRLVKNLHDGIEYDVSDIEKTALRDKIANRIPEYIRLPPETPEMFERYNTAPARRDVGYTEILANLRQILVNDTY